MNKYPHQQTQNRYRQRRQNNNNQQNQDNVSDDQYDDDEQHSGQQLDQQIDGHDQINQHQDTYNNLGSPSSTQMTKIKDTRTNSNKNINKQNKKYKKRKKRQFGCCKIIMVVLVFVFIFVNAYLITRHSDQYQITYENNKNSNINKHNKTDASKQGYSKQEMMNNSISNSNNIVADIRPNRNIVTIDIHNIKNLNKNGGTETPTTNINNTDTLNDTLNSTNIQQQQQQNKTDTIQQQQQQYLSIQTLRKLPLKHDTKQTIKQTVNKQNRIKLAAPHGQIPPINAYIISKYNNNNNNVCMIVNGLSSITNITTQTISTLLFTTSVLNNIIIYSRYNDQHIINQLLLNINNNKNRYKYKMKKINNVVINATYQFITQYLYNQGQRICDKIMYMPNSNIVIDVRHILILYQYINSMQPYQVLYTSHIQYRQQQQQQSLQQQYIIQQLPNLNTTNLEHMPSSILSQYIYIFDPIYLNIITPLNHACYIRYTLNQLIILPILAITQLSPYLIPIQQTAHTAYAYLYQDNQFIKLTQLNYNNNKRKQRQIIIQNGRQNNKKYSYCYCFVSYTSNPYIVDNQQLGSYLGSIQAMDASTNPQVYAIIYVPYKYQNNVSLWATANTLFAIQRLSQSQQQGIKFTSLRLRIRANKTLSSHAVYQSAYQYCPKQSIMISSRHNIQYLPNFLTQVSSAFSTKKHYYHTNYIDSNNSTNTLPHAPVYIQKKRFQIRHSTIFQQHYRHVQIFTNTFMRTVTYWVLKSGQLQFYQTQAVFFILMMQTIKLQIQYINITLYTVLHRQYTVRQQQQIVNIKKYAQYGWLPKLIINPYKYNSLDNIAYSKNRPNIIQPNIHQIWLGYSKISDIRMDLHNSIYKINPQFNVYLWRSNNITKQTFPIMYGLVYRVLEYHKMAKTSFMAMAADLLRYQVIYQYGGIYVDFKMQANRPADGFLKYQSFYLDAGNGDQRFGNPVAVGVGVIGANKNNYHLKIILYQLIEQSRIRFIFKGIPKQTGGFIARKAYTQQQLFTTMGLGYHLLFPKPYDHPVNQCGSFDNNIKVFTSDQKIYTMYVEFQQKQITIGLPCKQYPQSYFINFTPLARTWRTFNKQQT